MTNTGTGTNSVAIFREELRDRDVYLVDTPGFDDTNREDVEILTAVAHYLSVSYANNVSVNGILYLHRISDTRIGSSTKRNLEMMRALCGEDAFSNIAVVTTMWASDKSEMEFAKQCSREQELRDIYLSSMLEKGSCIVRHDRCQTLSERRISAKNIFVRMVELWEDTQVTLEIQHEMVDLNMTLKETSAGRVLERYIRESQMSYESDLKQLGTASHLPRHGSNETQLHRPTHVLLRDAHHSQEIQKMIKENNQALEAMRLSLIEVHAKQEKTFLDKVSVMENEWKESLRQREEEYRRKEVEYQKRRREEESRLEELDNRTHQLEERERALKERETNTRELRAGSRPKMTAQSAAARDGHQPTQRREAGQQQHQGTRRRRQDRTGEDELERLKLEVEKLRLETKLKLHATKKVKYEWKGPLVEGLVTGGIGLVGACITAGLLCCVQ
ncbi:hypothetical protein F5Y07DRAFT_403956 [Xylaria sp. FL0933]|nr:hypothetical protein F5Y07DRAFT_403956 [Xylaria sp. FL0933]